MQDLSRDSSVTITGTTNATSSLRLCKRGLHDLNLPNAHGANRACRICKREYNNRYQREVPKARAAKRRYEVSTKGWYRRYKSYLGRKIAYKEQLLKELEDQLDAEEV